MKKSHRLAIFGAALLAVLLVLAGATLIGTLRFGSAVLALAVVIAAAAGALAIGVAWSLARETEQHLAELLPPLPELPRPASAAGKAGFKVREARPGEVPEPYLAAVRKGAQARQAAWKAKPSQPADRV